MLLHSVENKEFAEKNQAVKTEKQVCSVNDWQQTRLKNSHLANMLTKEQL